MDRGQCKVIRQNSRWYEVMSGVDEAMADSDVQIASSVRIQHRKCKGAHPF
jgi:hypothetical protein